MNFKFLLLALSLMLTGATRANILLPAIFADHMVLQRNATVTIWGKADVAEKITLKTSFSKESVNTIADSFGNWEAKLVTIEAGGPYQISVKGKNEVKLKDVYLGEVWLSSGQSNMEFYVDSTSASYSGDLNFRKELDAADLPFIRIFKVQRTVARTAKDDCTGTWEVCSPTSIKKFSAVSYFFIKNLYEKLHIPVAIVNASWGGTNIDAWMRPVDLSGFDTRTNRLKRMLNDTVRIDQTYPSSLYNGMIAPLVKFNFKGVIWYQGENNVHTCFEYDKLFKNQINGWREVWQNADMPFLFVQIAPYDYLTRPWFKGNAKSLGLMVEKQTSVLTLKNTGMARTGDLGDTINIHPRKKQEVGKRLSMLALANVYEKPDKSYIYPDFSGISIEEKKVKVKFENATDGLIIKGNTLTGFELAGADKVFYPAKATIDHQTVIVSSPSVDAPVALRYCFKNTGVVNLFNRNNLPALPFRTDNWDL